VKNGRDGGGRRDVLAYIGIKTSSFPLTGPAAWPGPFHRVSADRATRYAHTLGRVVKPQVSGFSHLHAKQLCRNTCDNFVQSSICEGEIIDECHRLGVPARTRGVTGSPTITLAPEHCHPHTRPKHPTMHGVLHGHVVPDVGVTDASSYVLRYRWIAPQPDEQPPTSQL
jgi:hypothetical protein